MSTKLIGTHHRHHRHHHRHPFTLQHTEVVFQLGQYYVDWTVALPHILSVVLFPRGLKADPQHSGLLGHSQLSQLSALSARYVKSVLLYMLVVLVV